jgi:hypothetical protein
MPYGYLGQNTPNQTVSNSGIFSISDVASLEKQGKFGGSLELIEEQNITSTVEFINFTNIKESVYDVHLLEVRNLHKAVNSTLIQTRFSTDGGSSYIASGYQYAHQRCQANGSFQEDKSSSTTSILLANATGSGTNEVSNFYCYLYNLGNSAKYSFVTLHNVYNISATLVSAFGGGVLPQANTVNAFRLQSNVTNSFASAEIKLYGVKQL